LGFTLGIIETHMTEPVLNVEEMKLSIDMFGNPTQWGSGKPSRKAMAAQLSVTKITKLPLKSIKVYEKNTV
jgi:hypothetical protein